MQSSDKKNTDEPADGSGEHDGKSATSIHSIGTIVFQKSSTSKWRRRKDLSNIVESDDVAENTALVEPAPPSPLPSPPAPASPPPQPPAVQPAAAGAHTAASEPVPPPPVARKSLLAYAAQARAWLLTCTLSPLHDLHYAWLVVTSVCYIYNMVFIIARCSFWLLQDAEHYYVWALLDYALCDLVYLVDIAVRCSTRFMDKGELCADKPRIVTRYIRSLQFKLDLVAVAPVDAVFWLVWPRIGGGDGASRGVGVGVNAGILRWLPALRFNRLLKFARLLEFRSITETQTKYPLVFRMSNLLVNILLAMHWNACVYFLVSYLVGFGSDPWVFPALTEARALANHTRVQLANRLLTHRLDVQYVYCFWWSVQTLTTIAEVPPPTADYQELYMSVLLMAGVVILAITIGSAGDMVENANRHSLELQTKSDHAKSYLTQNKIGGELEARIKSYLDYLWMTPDLNQSDILDRLPANLRKEIAMDVHMETLKRVHVFQDCEPGLLGDLVTKLKLQIYSPGDYVCRKGDVGHEMYFIKMGVLQVVSPDGSKVFASLSAGAAFGEISILDIPGNKNGNKRTANIRSLGFADVYQLSKDDLWSALSEYPVAKQSLLEKGKALLKKDNLLDDELAERAERKLKPVHEQAKYFEAHTLLELEAHIDDSFQKYTHFVKETKKSLESIEKNFGF